MLGSGGEITPVTGFTGQKLAELIGYEREKRRITENTEALVPGKAESNVRFTAVPEQEKSTVKAIANEFAASRLIAEAETFSLRKSGRSPRCAKQYVELICAGVNTTKAGKAL